MYICPTCQKEFELENLLVKHYLKCWKQKNPNYKSKPAPHSADVINTNINDDILNFFNQF